MGADVNQLLLNWGPGSRRVEDPKKIDDSRSEVLDVLDHPPVGILIYRRRIDLPQLFEES